MHQTKQERDVMPNDKQHSSHSTVTVAILGVAILAILGINEYVPTVINHNHAPEDAGEPLVTIPEDADPNRTHDRYRVELSFSRRIILRVSETEIMGPCQAGDLREDVVPEHPCRCAWDSETATQAFQEQGKLVCLLDVLRNRPVDLRVTSYIAWPLTTNAGNYPCRALGAERRFENNPDLRITVTRNGVPVRTSPTVAAITASSTRACALHVADTPCESWMARLPNGGCWPTTPR